MAYGQELTSAQRKNVPLLEKYMCKVCENWKEAASFSNKQLNDYSHMVLTGKKPNGVTARLKCRMCSGGAVTEKQCQGVCKMWKDLQQFSKSARSNGGSGACKICTLWVESQEPDVVTQAPPGGENADGDDDDDGWTPSSTFDDPEAGESDSDYEDFARTTTSNAGTNRSTRVSAPAPGARQSPSVVTTSVVPRQHMAVPYNALATLSLKGANNTSNAGTGRTMPTANISAAKMSGVRIPPASALQSGTGTATGVGSRNTPVQFDIKSLSSISNPYEIPSNNQTAWGAMDARRRPDPHAAQVVNYTGWDNKGQPHAQQRFPSASASQTQANSASFTSNSTPVPTPVTAPVVPAAFQNARNSSWARPVGQRNPRQGSAPPPRQPVQAREPDSDDSDDDLWDM